MMTIQEVADSFGKLLHLEAFANDVSNNGLQVCADASRECRKAAFAVDACLKTIEMAVEAKADVLIVHHGLSWGGEPRRWNGFTGKRFAELFRNNLALLALHIPLDAHPSLGNNARLADLMGVQERVPFADFRGMSCGCMGVLSTALAAEAASSLAADGKPFKLYSSPDAPPLVRRVAVCSGSAGEETLIEAIERGADLLVTGEFEHVMYHTVRENPIHVAALGHYASEVHGVQALMRVARETFNVEPVWLDAPTGL